MSAVSLTRRYRLYTVKFFKNIFRLKTRISFSTSNCVVISLLKRHYIETADDDVYRRTSRLLTFWP